MRETERPVKFRHNVTGTVFQREQHQRRSGRVVLEQDLVLLGGWHMVDDGAAIEGERREDPRVRRRPREAEDRLVVLVEGLDQPVGVGVGGDGGPGLLLGLEAAGRGGNGGDAPGYA